MLGLEAKAQLLQPPGPGRICSVPFLTRPPATGHQPPGRAKLFCRKMSGFCSRKGLPDRGIDTSTARLLTRP